jgi:hypothetical protein
VNELAGRSGDGDVVAALVTDAVVRGRQGSGTPGQDLGGFDGQRAGGATTGLGDAAVVAAVRRPPNARDEAEVRGQLLQGRETLDVVDRPEQTDGHGDVDPGDGLRSWANSEFRACCRSCSSIRATPISICFRRSRELSSVKRSTGRSVSSRIQRRVLCAKGVQPAGIGKSRRLSKLWMAFFVAVCCLRRSPRWEISCRRA